MRCKFCPSRFHKGPATTRPSSLLLPRPQEPTSRLPAPLAITAVPPRDADDLDVEPFLREVARLEGLDSDELVEETRRLLDKYALLWDQMRAEGRLR